MNLHPSALKVKEAATELGLDVNIVEFSEITRTAQEASTAIGCGVAQIVKSLLFIVDGEPVMTLVSGINRLDERKLARIRGVGRKKVKRAGADEVKAMTGYSIGGVPPFGHKTRLAVYVDEDLNTFDVVWAAAGTPYAVFPISPADLLRVSEGITADLKA